ncbi:site-specific integrase [Micromonospora coxensis]|uniref:hypothetical protein n=1 Tax=Micromonospora coxensis TaxID=356852 RepID=UPI001E4C3100|nr:hypothetical protein [Micromonospora coxensis]
MRADGLPINPNYATTRFRKLVQPAGLPPVRLHDLRHSVASLAHEAGADLKRCGTCSGTPASSPPPTPTPASRPKHNAAAPTPPPTSSWPRPAAPAERPRTRPGGADPTRGRKQVSPPPPLPER